MTSHPTDDLAAFALGALDPDDARTVAAHVAGCATCSADVRAFAETAWRIAETGARDAPPAMRAAILERARSGPRSAGANATLASIAAMLRRPLPLAVPLALAVVLVVSLAGYVGARRDADSYAAALAGIAGSRIVTLAATGEVSGVNGSLIIPASGAQPYLILELPSAASGKTWQAWVIRGETATPAGITDARGVTTLVLSARPGAGDTVAVTAEPSGGVDRPTGKPVLAGRT
jgi:hypothetical protein